MTEVTEEADRFPDAVSTAARSVDADVGGIDVSSTNQSVEAVEVSKLSK